MRVLLKARNYEEIYISRIRWSNNAYELIVAYDGTVLKRRKTELYSFKESYRRHVERL